MNTFATPRDQLLALIAHLMSASLEKRWMDTPMEDLPWCDNCRIDIDPTTAECECWDYNTDAPLTHWPSQDENPTSPLYSQQ